MNPLTAAFRDHARAGDADLVGIANVERFVDLHPVRPCFLAPSR